MLHQEGHSIRTACKVADLSRSSYYYQASELEEAELVDVWSMKLLGSSPPMAPGE